MEMRTLLSNLIARLEEAGSLLLSGPRTWSPGLDTSSDGDIAVNIFLDRALKDLLNAPILSEESNQTPQTAEWLWIVDPIDGTLNYVAGSAEFGTSVALVRQNNLEPVLGVVIFPRLNMTFSAIQGEGAYLNNVRLPIARIVDSESVKPRFISVGLPVDATLFSERFGNYFARLLQSGWVVRQSGSAAFDICRTATGIWTAFHETGLKRWDIAAADLIATESGCLRIIGPSTLPSQTGDDISLDYLVCRDSAILAELSQLTLIDK